MKNAEAGLESPVPPPSVEKTVEVSQAKIGYVIGRRGSRIQMIQSRTGCEVDVIPPDGVSREDIMKADQGEPFESGEKIEIPPDAVRRVLVRGIDQGEVDTCCALIEEVSSAEAGHVELACCSFARIRCHAHFPLFFLYCL